jgi:signal transduction histidine kinase
LDITSEAPPEKKPARSTLLVVDDEEGPRQSLKIVFKSEYDVLVASNGPDALALAREHSIDVAVLDILMEGMSGVDLLRELKTLDPSIEVVMLTAYETIETARQALRYGASDYLNKPFDIPTMRAAISRALSKHHASVAFHSTNDRLQALQKEIAVQRAQEEMARTKGEIYASVLHDINSPLTVISGFVELINRSMQNAARVEGQQLENIKGDLKQLHGQVGRCFEISRRYLSFLHAKSAESSYVGVRQMLADLEDLLTRHPSARGHELIIHKLDPDACAEINGTDFLQIMLNLTINALQSTDMPHRVEVKARRMETPVDITTIADSATERVINRSTFLNRAPLLAISVANTGPGISPFVLSRMFEEKFTTKSADRGTGLGLSIVRRLLTEAKGAIHLQTDPDEGSTFTVYLQIAE